MPVSVLVDGVDRACDVVAGTLRVGVGRRSVREAGQPGFCAFEVRHRGGDFVAPFDTVQVGTGWGWLFAGTVSEVNLYHDERGRAWQTVNCSGPLASWGTSAVGAAPWPKETVAERAQRIADLLGEPIVILGGDTQNVDRQDVDSQTGAGLLSQLSDSIAGMLFDGPGSDGSGTIYLQALDARRVVVSTVTWELEPAASTWDELDAGTRWVDEDETAFAPIDLTGCWVRRDPGPVWVSRWDIANRVHVTWGQDGASLSTYEDPASIALYGVHDTKLDTPLDDLADVVELGTLILGRASVPVLEFPTVDIDLERLPVALASQLIQVVPGTRVTVHDLPQPAPAHAFLGCVEGFEVTVTGPGSAAMRLHVSDVAASLAVPAWDELDPLALWDDEPVGADWESELG